MRYILLFLSLLILSPNAFARDMDCHNLIVEKRDTKPIEQNIIDALKIKGVERLPLYRPVWELQFETEKAGMVAMTQILYDYRFIFRSVRCESVFNMEPIPPELTPSEPTPDLTPPHDPND